ncbi:MAG: bacterial transcriptional activator domain-containing protein [Bacteroidales bacterium]|nr:bacterial transcriptional activator domain-containing protein [Bacteroidales bacterium]
MARGRIISLLLAGLLLTVPAFIASSQQQDPERGLVFRSDGANFKLPTSLDLCGGKPLRPGKGGFRLDYSLRLTQNIYGYVCRLIVNDTLSVDVISNLGWSHGDNILLVSGGKTVVALSNKEFKNLGEDWMDFSIDFDARHGMLGFRIDTLSFDVPGELPPVRNLEIFFGRTPKAGFASIDAPSMILRDVRLYDSERRLAASWPMYHHGNGFVLDSLHSRKALVDGGEWLIDEHVLWKKLSSFLVGGQPAQTCPAPDGGSLYVAGTKNLYNFDFNTLELQETPYLFGNPYKSTSDCLLPTQDGEGLISFSVSERDLDLYSFRNRIWSSDAQNTHLSLSQNSHAMLPDGRIVLFGGYDEYHFSGSLFEYSQDFGWTEKDYSKEVNPRYLSGSSLIGGNDFYILGGYGSESGRQAESPGTYNDFFKIDLTAGHAEKICDIRNPDGLVFGSGLVNDSDAWYALGFNNMLPTTEVILCAIDTVSGKLTYLADRLPFNFKDISSLCGLVRDADRNQLVAYTVSSSGPEMSKVDIYSIAYPPYSSSAIFQEDKRADTNTELYAIIAAIVFFVISLVILFLWRRKVLREDDEYIPPESQPKGKGLYMLGGFRVINEEGEDLSRAFPPGSRNLLLFILLNKMMGNSNTTSRQLDEQLWEEDSELVANKRNVALNRLRSQLRSTGFGSLVFASGEWSVELSEDVDTDLPKMIRLLNGINTGVSRDERAAREFIRLGRNGSLLQNMFAPWLDSFKSQYDSSLGSAAEKLYHIVKGNHSLSLGVAEVMLASDPLDENAVVVKCRSLVAMGRSGHALSAYEAYVSEYERLMGVRPNLLLEDCVRIK